MDYTAIIRVSGLQMVEGTGENIEMLAHGKHYMKNNKHYLFYDDVEEEEGYRTKNTIKFDETCVEVIRKGTVNGKMVFEKGKNSQSLYSTPYGDLLVEVLTRKIALVHREKNVNLQIDYELYANNSKVSDSKIEIDVNEI